MTITKSLDNQLKVYVNHDHISIQGGMLKYSLYFLCLNIFNALLANAIMLQTTVYIVFSLCVRSKNLRYNFLKGMPFTEAMIDAHISVRQILEEKRQSQILEGLIESLQNNGIEIDVIEGEMDAKTIADLINAHNKKNETTTDNSSTQTETKTKIDNLDNVVIKPRKSTFIKS